MEMCKTAVATFLRFLISLMGDILCKYLTHGFIDCSCNWRNIFVFELAVFFILIEFKHIRLTVHPAAV